MCKQLRRYEVDYYLFDAPGRILKGAVGIHLIGHSLKTCWYYNRKTDFSRWIESENVGEAIQACASFYGRCVEWCGNE